MSANFRRSSREHTLHPFAIDVLSGQDNSGPPPLQPCALFELGSQCRGAGTTDTIAWE